MVWVYVRSLSLSFSVCMSVYFVNASGLLAVLSWRTKKCLGSILSPLSICIKVNYIIKIHVYCCMCACDFFFTCASFFPRCNLFFLSLDFFLLSLSRFFSFVVHLAIMYSVLIQACSVWHGVGARFGCAVVSAYSPYFFWNYFCIVGFECSSPSFSLCVRCFFFPSLWCFALFFLVVFCFLLSSFSRCFGHKLLVLLILASFWYFQAMASCILRWFVCFIYAVQVQVQT